MHVNVHAGVYFALMEVSATSVLCTKMVLVMQVGT